MKVVIEIQEGMAQVMRKPQGVTIVMVDHDTDTKEIYRKKEIIPSLARKTIKQKEKKDGT